MGNVRISCVAKAMDILVQLDVKAITHIGAVTARNAFSTKSACGWISIGCEVGLREDGSFKEIIKTTEMKTWAEKPPASIVVGNDPTLAKLEVTQPRPAHAKTAANTKTQ